MKIRGLRWWIIVLIGLVTVVNYIDRNALSIMWPTISKDLGLSKDDYKLILTFFMSAYMISQSVSGRIYDIIGTRLGFVFSICIWSLSSGLHSIASSFGFLATIRSTLGFGEAGNWPGAAKSNAEWFPVKERALAQGIFNAGASVGAIISAPLIATLYSTFGWRATFPIIASFGFLWLVPWLFINRGTPEKTKFLTDAEREYILGGKPKSAAGTTEKPLKWGQLLKIKQSYSVIVSRFFLDPIWWMFVAWLPIYLFEKFHFDIKQIGLFGWVPYVGAAAGSLLSGWISGKFIKSGWTVNKVRKSTITVGGIICFTALIFAASAAEPLSAVLLIAGILFGFQFAINNIQTLPSDFLSGKSVGSLAGLGGAAASLGTIICMWFVPWLSKISWYYFFIMGAVLVPIGLAAVFIFAGTINKLDEQEIR
jgi:ACS family hexuronate transporter-like MFS transporter